MNKTLTPAQRAAFFRALQAASAELGHDTPDEREAYRKRVMREECGKAHLAPVVLEKMADKSEDIAPLHRAPDRIGKAECGPEQAHA